MNGRFIELVAMSIVVILVGPGISRAQSGHLDVLTLQENGRLVTGESVCNDAGCTTQQTVLGERVFFNEFPATFFVTKPGFASPGTGSAAIPDGTQALPATTDLSWDFLPFTIDGVGSNLFYWQVPDIPGPDLSPADVAFGALPGANYSLSLYDQANHAHSVDGTDSFVPGGSIGKTDDLGHIHQHRTFYLVDHNGGSPQDGIYLLAIHMRVAGLSNSLPVFVLFGTENTPYEALDNASVPWVEDQLDLPGDYNGDGVVNAADYTVWRDTFGLEGPAEPADGDGDSTVDAGDYDVWKQYFGTAADLQIPFQSAGSGAVLPSAPVPEPATLTAALVAAIAWSAATIWRSRSHRSTAVQY
jgi:hypothetical protein